MTSYILLLEVKSTIHLVIGSKRFSLSKGEYIYIGSANIRRPYLRIHRHMVKRKKVKWHIDYLTINPSVAINLGVICYDLSEDMLYSIVLNFFRPTIKGFGCTDSKKHLSHLFRSCSHKCLGKLIDVFVRMCNAIEFIQ